MINKNIIIFSSDDWDSGMKTSKYHIAIHLSQKNRVLYINSIGLRKPELSKRDFFKILRKIIQLLY